MAATKIFLVYAFAALAVAVVVIAESPSFEAASIRPNHSDEAPYGVRIVPGGNIRVINAPLEAIITTAYQIADFEMAGTPGWAKTERWDIETKAGVTDPTPANVLQMLRTLLADRFALKTHKESRELPVYALVVAKTGPKLKASTEECFDVTAGIPPPTPTARPCGGFNRTPEQLLGARDTMQNLAKVLSKIVGRTVIDKTGLAGSYDITLNWKPDDLQPDRNAAGNDSASLFTSIQEQLGLRLDSEKAPVEILVIDSVERPSAN